jgi:hypothetical protein
MCQRLPGSPIRVLPPLGNGENTINAIESDAEIWPSRRRDACGALSSRGPFESAVQDAGDLGPRKRLGDEHHAREQDARRQPTDGRPGRQNLIEVPRPISIVS